MLLGLNFVGFAIVLEMKIINLVTFITKFNIEIIELFFESNELGSIGVREREMV